jgi:hypothetical protein
MYTFNDHQEYGVLEVLENLILDFEETGRDYLDQWAVCECLALFLATDIGGAVTGYFPFAIPRLFVPSANVAPRAGLTTAIAWMPCTS